MTGETLEFIFAVYKYRSFKEAANMLNVSYSNLVKQISRAEQTLGIKIFERGNGHQDIRLTNEGSKIIVSVEKAVYASRDIFEISHSYTHINKKKINIGLSLLYDSRIETDIISNLIKNNELNISVHHYDNEYLLNKVSSGVLDGVFIPIIKNSIQYSEELLKKAYVENLNVLLVQSDCSLYMLMSEKHPLTKYKTLDKVSYDELISQKMIFTTTAKGNLISIPNDLFDFLNIKKKDIYIHGIDESNLKYLVPLLRNSDMIYPNPRYDSSRIIPGIMAIPFENWNGKCDTYFIYSQNNTNALDILNGIASLGKSIE